MNVRIGYFKAANQFGVLLAKSAREGALSLALANAYDALAEETAQLPNEIREYLGVGDEDLKAALLALSAGAPGEA
jgi:hypothetical protein